MSPELHGDIDVLRLLAGRPLAIHREALSGLAETARLRARMPSGDVTAAATRRRSPSAIQSREAVAIIPVHGVIMPHESLMSWLFGGGAPLDQLSADLRAATADPQVTAIVLDFDSPGGDVAMVQETAAEIRQARTVKPVIGFVRGLAASAAFWLASQCDELIATPSADLGSVGVVLVHYDESGLNAKVGIVPEYVYAGEFKIEQSPDAPLSQAARDYLQEDVDRIYELFVGELAGGRGTSAAKVKATFGKGRLVDAGEAVKRGMADRIATFDSMIAGVGVAVAQHRHRRAAIERDAMDLSIAIRTRGGAL